MEKKSLLVKPGGLAIVPLLVRGDEAKTLNALLVEKYTFLCSCIVRGERQSPELLANTLAFMFRKCFQDNFILKA